MRITLRISIPINCRKLPAGWTPCHRQVGPRFGYRPHLPREDPGISISLILCLNDIDPHSAWSSDFLVYLPHSLVPFKGVVSFCNEPGGLVPRPARLATSSCLISIRKAYGLRMRYINYGRADFHPNNIQKPPNAKYTTAASGNSLLRAC